MKDEMRLLEEMPVSRLLAFALILFVSPALSAERMPRLDIQATCNAAVPLIPGDRSPKEACFNDENGAQAELEKQWDTYPVALREKCVGEATVGSYPSYVELLTCLQIGNGTLQNPPSSGYRRPGR